MRPPRGERNGLYTRELLRALQEPGLKLEEVFKRVRQAVRLKTNGRQVPWEASSIEGDFVFRKGDAARTLKTEDSSEGYSFLTATSGWAPPMRVLRESGHLTSFYIDKHEVTINLDE